MSQIKKFRMPRYIKSPRAKYFFRKVADHCYGNSQGVDVLLMAEVAFAMEARERLAMGKDLEVWKISAMEKQQEIITNGLRQLAANGATKPERRITNTLDKMEIK